MTNTPEMTTPDLYFDPYDMDVTADPYPVLQRMREEAPLYYNEPYDFYALSRYDDVVNAARDLETFSSSKGDVLEIIKADVQQPPWTLFFEDPPSHTVHRALLTRVFTPRRMAALEPKIREFTARCLDPLVGAGGFDFVADLGAVMPTQVIYMLLGIPEQDQMAVRERVSERLRTEPGQPMRFAKGEKWNSGSDLTAMFGEYIDWRAQHPSEDLMTSLLNAEFEDEHGVSRRLTRDEILLTVTILTAAGDGTVNRLIGWAGKVLADHPEQRRELAENPALVPNAVGELLRYEAPAPMLGRYVTRDVEFYGQTVPAGSAMLLLAHSANRDDRRFAEPDRFDIHREIGPHLTFGHGIHFCLGAALARVEGRVAVEEVLKRFPEWEVDTANACMAPRSVNRGWDTLPVFTP